MNKAVNERIFGRSLIQITASQKSCKSEVTGLHLKTINRTSLVICSKALVKILHNVTPQRASNAACYKKEENKRKQFLKVTICLIKHSKTIQANIIKPCSDVTHS